MLRWGRRDAVPPTSEYFWSMFWILWTLTTLACAHHHAVEKFLARAPFEGDNGSVSDLRFARDHTAWFRPGSGTADYDGEHFRWHRQGNSIYLEFNEFDGFPDRVAILAHEGQEYVVPWSNSLCAALPSIDWTALASSRQTRTRPASASEPLPRELDVCESR